MSADQPTEPVVTDVPDRSRYELSIDETVVAYAEYQPSGDRVAFTHTFTDPRQRGRGLAAILVRGALDDMHRQNKLVDPQCWYVAQYIDEHPEFGDLLG